ncbi:hypothetical protein [uncultured Robinsoniella sp.]|uniref:hypothetical protein n=1 Tax=uncultured Robinsoniella sp. TaxID=904190 RepID=UPI00374FB048
MSNVSLLRKISERIIWYVSIAVKNFTNPKFICSISPSHIVHCSIRESQLSESNFKTRFMNTAIVIITHYKKAMNGKYYFSEERQVQKECNRKTRSGKGGNEYVESEE